MSLVFEWDRHKAEGNRHKHGVSFEEAGSAFRDIFSLTISDPAHSESEDRYILVGCSFRNRLLVVVHTERGNRIRIISSRCATKKERKAYEKKS